MHWKWLAAAAVPLLSFAVVMNDPDARLAFWQQAREGTLLWHAVARDDLRPGDHIYAKRLLGLYTHHGLVVVRHDVILSPTLP